MERVPDRAAPTVRVRRIRRRTTAWTGRVALLALLAASLLALTASVASAVIVQLPNGKKLSYQPLRGAKAPAGANPLAALPLAGTNLIYHGGAVMTSNTNYTFYWAPSGSPAYAAGYQEGVNRYLEDLAHDSGGEQNVDSVATQYTGEGSQVANYDSHFAGAIIDTDPYPKNGCKEAATCLTDAQIQAELKTYVHAHALPEDLEHEYFVLTPPGVESCFNETSECSAGSKAPAYCAYHGSFAGTGGKIVYADDPYVVGIAGCDSKEHPNNSPSDAALLGGLSHEHNESITDPELDAWYGPEGEENGDKCRTFEETSEYGTPLGTAPDGSRYNQLINADEYWYQQEWSNKGSTCLQRLGITVVKPVITKISPKSGVAAGGTSVTITGTGFSAATGVSFGSTAAAKFTINSATSITAISPAGTSGSVEVSVTTPAGTSAATSADLFKYKAPTVTSVTPNSGPKAGGTSVTIKGSGFALGAATTIKFAAGVASAVNCTSTTTCTAVSPAHPKTGVVDVKATANGLSSPKSVPADQFTYL